MEVIYQETAAHMIEREYRTLVHRTIAELQKEIESKQAMLEHERKVVAKLADDYLKLTGFHITDHIKYQTEYEKLWEASYAKPAEVSCSASS